MPDTKPAQTIHFPEPRQTCIFLRRYKRFLADVALEDGSVSTVHCPNPGAMTSCVEEGRPAVIGDGQNPRRKLSHTLELVHMGQAWVGTNTHRPNGMMAHWIGASCIPELAGYAHIQREVAYPAHLRPGLGPKSRVDLVLTKPGQPDCWVEIKSVTLKVQEHAAFPDSVTKRGLRHLEDLVAIAATGARAVLLLAVGRKDCTRVRPAWEIDPAYAAKFRDCQNQGVEILAYRIEHSPTCATLGPRLPIDSDEAYAPVEPNPCPPRDVADRLATVSTAT